MIAAAAESFGPFLLLACCRTCAKSMGPASCTALVMLGLSMAQGKGPCTDYFGPVDVGGTVTTVLDPDVPSGFPTGRLGKVHHSGPDSVCLPPGPPKERLEILRMHGSLGEFRRDQGI